MDEILTQKFKDEKRRLLSFITMKVGDADEAEDILQEVFESAILNFNTIRSLETVTSWLFSVAKNKIADYFRAKKRVNLDIAELEDILQDMDAKPMDEVKIAVFTEKVSQIISSMPEKPKQVFIMHELDLLTFREISEITGTPISTLLSRKKEAMAYLKKKLKNKREELL
ncbi:sigma-70 family RNA polymerase sigma factor [candidate division WOR-3 bacterium]|nr:sigma-70 family RNA polymerase sigma factor [candidate division WOR-3 bacterium]